MRRAIGARYVVDDGYIVAFRPEFCDCNDSPGVVPELATSPVTTWSGKRSAVPVDPLTESVEVVRARLFGDAL